jgi:hypothetical protein
MAREGVSLIVIQRQLGHTSLGITSIYTQAIDFTEIIDTVDVPPPTPDGPPRRDDGPNVTASRDARRALR